MIFLNPIVISYKIQLNSPVLKAKSLAASVAVHAALLAAALYLGTHPSMPLPEEAPVLISLADYASSADASPTQTLTHPSAAKNIPPMPSIHSSPKRPVPTAQAIAHSTLAVSPEAFTPQSSPVRPGVVPSNLNPSITDSPHSNQKIVAPDSPKITSSALTNELPKSSDDGINGATLGRIRALIENSLTYPSIARKLRLEGTVVVSFILKPDGLVEKAEIITSSGSNLLDTKAVQTVLALSGDYPTLTKTAYLKIPIAFSLTKS